MAALRTWSGRQALVGLVACFVALQVFVAGLHAATIVDRQFLANDLSSICHGGTSETGTPTLPSTDHADACCLFGCNLASQVAQLPDAWPSTVPALHTTRVAPPVRSFALLPSHLIDRAHRPRSPPSV
jgi:hypothetical protein